MIDSDNPYKDILRIKVGLAKYYITKKGFFQDLKLVLITIISLFLPKRMGHYLLMKLLKIQDNKKFRINEIISTVKIKNIAYRKREKESSSNSKILLYADVIAILSGFIIAGFLRHDLTVPAFIFSNDIFLVLGSIVFIKFLSFKYFKMYLGMWRYTSVMDLVNIIKANIIKRQKF